MANKYNTIQCNVSYLKYENGAVKVSVDDRKNLEGAYEKVDEC